MKKQFFVCVTVVSLGLLSGSAWAAEPAGSQNAAPARPGNPAEAAGRVVTEIFTLAGSALRWTGEAATNVANGAGRAVTNLVNSLDKSKSKG